MKTTADDLEKTVRDFASKHAGTEDGYASINLGPDKWSLKEILGHLIDSAANNHQRFVRLQETAVLEFPAYSPEWIAIQKYNDMNFDDLLDLWKSYNIFLAHLMRTADPGSLTHVWVRDEADLTLEFLMTDYLEHLRSHLAHFGERMEELRRRGSNRP